VLEPGITKQAPNDCFTLQHAVSAELSDVGIAVLIASPSTRLIDLHWTCLSRLANGIVHNSFRLLRCAGSPLAVT
jgi:hypothetical protein